MATMRTLKLTRDSPATPPTMTFTTVPKPSLPVDNTTQLLIKIHASAIHPSDLLNADGLFPLTSYPRIPGRDFAGTVEAAPSSHSKLIGTKVYGSSGPTYAFSKDGFQAEYAVVGVDEVAPMPSNLSFTQAAVLGVPFTTAKLILKRGMVQKGESVLILGANGAVGSAVVQVAEGMGCKVLKAGRGKGPGIDVDTSSDPELSAVKELTSGKGADVVIDTVGQSILTSAAVKALALRGRLVFISAPRTGSTEMGIDMQTFYRLEKQLVGVNSLTYSAGFMAPFMGELTPLFEQGVLQAAKEGEWTPVSLEKAVDAYQALREKKTKEKFVVVMD